MDVMSTSPSSTKVQSCLGANILLLRRPRPPKQVLKLPPFSDGAATTTAITSKDIMVRQKTVPIHHDLYRTNNIEEMVNERSKFIIHPPHPKGPKFFPPGKVIRTLGQISLDPLDILPDVIHLPSSEPIFTLDDFLIQTAYHIPLEVSQGTMSRENYLKLTSWYATNVPIQENLNTLDLEIDHEAPLGRVPRRQILIGKLNLPVH